MFKKIRKLFKKEKSTLELDQQCDNVSDPDILCSVCTRYHYPKYTAKSLKKYAEELEKASKKLNLSDKLSEYDVALVFFIVFQASVVYYKGDSKLFEEIALEIISKLGVSEYAMRKSAKLLYGDNWLEEDSKLNI